MKISSLDLRWFALLRIIGIVVFLFVLFSYDIRSAWNEMKLVIPSYFLGALALQLLLLLLKSIRWHLLISTDKSNKKLIQSFGEFLESYAFGLVTPGRLGDLTKIGYQKNRTDKLDSGIKAMIERGLDFGCFVTLAGMALVWGSMIISSRPIGGAVISIGLVAMADSVLLGTSSGIYRIISRVSRKIPLLESQVTPKTMTLVLLLSLATNLFYFLSCYCLAKGINMPASFITVSGGVSLAGLLNIIPVTVMGLGTREVTFLYVFQQLPHHQILALSGLVMIVSQIGGGIMALFLGQVCLYFSSKTVP